MPGLGLFTSSFISGAFECNVHVGVWRACGRCGIPARTPLSNMRVRVALDEPMAALEMQLPFGACSLSYPVGLGAVLHSSLR